MAGSELAAVERQRPKLALAGKGCICSCSQPQHSETTVRVVRCTPALILSLQRSSWS
jgi:hypothetical protein